MVKSLHFPFQIWVKGENCRHNVKKVGLGMYYGPDHVQVIIEAKSETVSVFVFYNSLFQV